MIRYICGTLIACGLIFLLGTVGAAENNMISFSTLVIRCVITLLVICISYVILIFNERKN